MNIERLFDLACNYNSPDGKSNYPYKTNSGKEVMLNMTDQGKVIRRSIQAFIHGYKIEMDSKRRIQAFSGSTDLAQMTKDVFTVTQQELNHDIYWQEAFRSIPLKRGQLSWEIANINSGSAFELMPEGAKVKIFGITGTKVQVDVAKYGMGMGVTWETIEGRKLYLFWDQLRDVQAKLMTLWANTHYGLLATAGATNQITYQGAAADGQLSRDIATLNKGLHDISEDNKDSGYGNPTEFKFKFYPDPILEERIEAAFRWTGGNQPTTQVTTAPAVKRRRVDRFYSYNSNIPTNKALLVIPGNKIQNAVYMKDKSLSKEEMESLNQLKSYWTAYGAAIGDNDQVYELAFA